MLLRDVGIILLHCAAKYGDVSREEQVQMSSLLDSEFFLQTRQSGQIRIVSI